MDLKAYLDPASNPRSKCQRIHKISGSKWYTSQKKKFSRSSRGNFLTKTAILRLKTHAHILRILLKYISVPKSAILKLKPNKDESAILNSRQTKKVNYQRVLVLQAESVTKGRIWNHATLFAKSGRRKAKNHETLLCKSGRKKTNQKSRNLGYIARIKTNVESVRCIKGRHTRSFNGCRFRGQLYHH